MTLTLTSIYSGISYLKTMPFPHHRGQDRNYSKDCGLSSAPISITKALCLQANSTAFHRMGGQSHSKLDFVVGILLLSLLFPSSLSEIIFEERFDGTILSLPAFFVYFLFFFFFLACLCHHLIMYYVCIILSFFCCIHICLAVVCNGLCKKYEKKGEKKVKIYDFGY